MTDDVKSIILEHLKRIQPELSGLREQNREVISRLSHLETAVVSMGRELSAVRAEIVSDRHAMDGIRDRIERIERRLELI